MFFVHGQYHFRPKRTAFRNDFCLFCEKPRRAIQVRTLDVWHFFWIPLIPLGLWKRWHCTACGHSPAFNPRNRRRFIGTLAALAAAFAGVFWLIPVEQGLEQGQGDIWWFFRIRGPVGSARLTFRFFLLP